MQVHVTLLMPRRSDDPGNNKLHMQKTGPFLNIIKVNLFFLLMIELVEKVSESCFFDYSFSKVRLLDNIQGKVGFRL